MCNRETPAQNDTLSAKYNSVLLRNDALSSRKAGHSGRRRKGEPSRDTLKLLKTKSLGYKMPEWLWRRIFWHNPCFQLTP
jgi:hypothetical protein